MAVDEQRFDRLARTVGGQRTRREALRWLGGSMAAVSALVRGESAAARARSARRRLFDSGQCRSDGVGPVYCDDNGYAYDGPLNCCRYEGGFCGENHRTAAVNWNVGTAAIAPTSQSPRPRSGLPVGASCTDTSQSTEEDTGSSASGTSPCRG